LTDSPAIHFGTDGWRGVIADEFTFANVRRVALATGHFIKQQRAGGPILIGYDRRFLSKQFADCVGEVFQSQGLAVRLSQQPMPTPAISVCVTTEKAPWGIMITASHNPAFYNGFKIKDTHGRSAPPEVTQAIEQLINQEQNPSPAPLPLGRGEGRGEGFASFDFNANYERYLKSRLDWKILKTLKGTVVFDHLYGTAAGIPEALLKNTSLKIISLHASLDPLFGGLHPEPIEANLAELKNSVRKNRALLGIALDGDADRLGLVDDTGQYLTPHQVFPLLALHCIEHKGWKGKIVQSVSLGALGERIAQAFGLPFEEVPVGFKHVAERMLKEDILAGGEESGGYAIRGGIPERDGILSGLLFLEMLAARKKKLSLLLRDMEKRFGRARFKRIDMPLGTPIGDKFVFVKRMTDSLPDRLLRSPIAQVRTQDGLKICLQNGAWVLLRPSGTEPLLRTYAESESWNQTDQLLLWARKRVSEVLSKSSNGI